MRFFLRCGALAPMASGLLAALLAAGCASPPAVPGSSSASPSGDPLAPLALSRAASAVGAAPDGWRVWTIRPDKRKTRYEVAVQMVDGAPRKVLHAQAESSASGLWVPADLPAGAATAVRWSWRADALIPGADSSRSETEDAPVRLILAFDGDWSKLPLREQMMAETARMLLGRDVPYATLIYTWDSGQPLETVIPNHYTGRVKKKVVESGPAELGRWRSYERDFARDFAEAFGEPPGKLIGIGVMTDTDNTRTSAQAWYGDIEVLAEREARAPAAVAGHP